MDKSILITGSSGMLGTALCYKCLEKYKILGVDIIKPKIADDRLSSTKLFELNVTDKPETVKLIKKTKPDYVIHAAAYTDVDGCEEDATKAFDINANATGNVALGCKETGSLLFYISTDSVFDGEKSMPYTEDDMPNPISVYGESKLEGEKAVKNILNKFIIIRTSWLFGKYGKNFVDTILKKSEKEKNIRVVTDQSGSPTYVNDLAAAIIKLAESVIDNPPATIYNITNSGSVSWCKYAEEILEYAGIKDVKVIPITSDELDRPAKRPKMSLLDNSRYQKTTGDIMRSYKEALREYISQERS